MKMRLQDRKSVSGAILVLVLVTLLLMSTVVLHVTQGIVTVAEEHIFLAQSAQAALQSEAARDLVVELLGTDGPWASQDGAQSASNVWEQGELRITIVPANAKLNLNAMRRSSDQSPMPRVLEQAVALLVAEAALGSAAGASVEEILDWITPEEGAASTSSRHRMDDRYERYEPRKGPLERPEELLLVYGFEGLDPVWVREHFTVWGEDERVNLNAASQKVLLALLPDLEAYWPAIDRYRGEQGFSRTDELLTRIRLPMEVYQRVLPRISLEADVFEALLEIRLPAWYELHRMILERQPFVEDASVRVLAADILESRPVIE